MIANEPVIIGSPNARILQSFARIKQVRMQVQMQLDDCNAPKSGHQTQTIDIRPRL